MDENHETIKLQAAQKIIGGKFGLPVDFSGSGEIPGFLKGDPQLLFNARSGIKLIVDSLRPRKIWLPTYLCPTILGAVGPHNPAIRYFPVDDHLKIKAYQFLKDLEAGDLLIFIDYFGFPTDHELISGLHNKGVILLQDCCQNLFFDPENSQADFCLYSPRKFVGIPDGGMLHVRPGTNFELPSLIPPPVEILYDLFRAIILRRDFDLRGGDRKWHDLFHSAESRHFAGHHAMSELTSMLLHKAFDYDKIMETRRDNFRLLARELQHIAIYNELPDDVVPLGFPIRIKERDRVQQFLFSRNIYPPVHWRITDYVPKRYRDSHQVSSEILTLPCDQRYSEADMVLMVEAVIDGLNA
jgi:hypothetical protein